MASESIGLVVGSTTQRVYAVINPDGDNELDNPRHLLLQNEEKEPVKMIKVERGAYMACLDQDDITTLLCAYYASAHYKPNEPAHEGEEHLEP